MKVMQFIAAALMASRSVAFFAPVSPTSLMRGQRVTSRSSSVTAVRMGDDTLEKKVIEVVGEQLGKTGSVLIDSNFIDDLDADSLDTIELMMSLEEEFGVEIAEEEAQKMVCVKDAVDYITAHK